MSNGGAERVTLEVVEGIKNFSKISNIILKPQENAMEYVLIVKLLSRSN